MGVETCRLAIDFILRPTLLGFWLLDLDHLDGLASTSPDLRFFGGSPVVPRPER